MTRQPKRIAYISGPLQAALHLAQARGFYEYLGQAVAEVGYEPYLPHLWTDPDLHASVQPGHVFQRDVTHLLASSVLIGDIGKPSSGVGAEIALAFREGIPIIGIFHRNERPSRFIIGMLKSTGCARMIDYSDPMDCRRKLQAELLGWIELTANSSSQTARCNDR